LAQQLYGMSTVFLTATIAIEEILSIDVKLTLSAVHWRQIV
jgi:hypothetical protein